MSSRPSVEAKPALVVASAGNPSVVSSLVVPTSCGLGITKVPLW